MFQSQKAEKFRLLMSCLLMTVVGLASGCKKKPGGAGGPGGPGAMTVQVVLSMPNANR
jgi:hypothetical protein